MPDTYGDDDLWSRCYRPELTHRVWLHRGTALDSKRKMHAIAEVVADALARVK